MTSLLPIIFLRQPLEHVGRFPPSVMFAACAGGAGQQAVQGLAFGRFFLAAVLATPALLLLCVRRFVGGCYVPAH